MYYRNRTIIQLKMHSDPSHGWLEFPRSLATKLGIISKISSCSYVLGGLLFLECDSDAALAIEALKQQGYPYEIAPRYYSDSCDIPNLHRFGW